MLDLSNDLFQTLVLALLVVTLLVLLMILTVLSRIRSALTGESKAEDAAVTAPDELAAPSAEESLAPIAETSIASEPATTGMTQTEHPVVQRSYDRADEPQQAAAAPTEASSATTDAVSGAVDTSQGEPQEQPFERDGRWYFRRGDELLVYDEVAAQWVQAEGSAQTSTVDDTATYAPSGASAAEPVPETTDEPALYERSTTAWRSPGSLEPDVGTTSQWGSPSVEDKETIGTSSWTTPAAADDEVAARETETPSDEAAAAEEPSEIGQPAPAPADFWRCPSCGAINGSTSPTCRMCFTPRP
ncbi:MAG: zinc finger Ran-binding domain-containing protein [Actinomycetota bacterium]|nr:zinc finger Ran-binding domain-containing protein [Actinomycetota bacterium]